MSDRYSRIYTLPDGLHIKDAPISIVSGKLLYDNEQKRKIVVLKLKNLTDISIQSVDVIIKTFNAKCLESDNVTNYTYKNFQVSDCMEFGSKKAIVIQNTDAVSFEVSIQTVRFSDGSSWDCPKKALSADRSKNTPRDKTEPQGSNKSNFDEIKKYKKLLDSQVITQQEFEQKKSELLGIDRTEQVRKQTTTTKKPHKTLGKRFENLEKKTLIMIVSIFLAVFTIVFGVSKVVEHKQHSIRAAALEEAIQPIMEDYGLDTYKVKYFGSSYDVFAEDFEELTKGEALYCLEELDNISINDPIDDSELDFGRTHVHPGLNVEYSYWRVPSYIVEINKMYGGGYKVPGLYCNEYGNECILEWDN